MPVQTMRTTLPELNSLPEGQVHAMRQAAEQVVEIAQTLAERGANVVSEVVAGASEFNEWNHYPKGDVRDRKSGGQYYYHSHNGAADEHGHFHTFMRYEGIPADMQPLPHDGSDAKEWPAGDQLITHLIAISMNHYGIPTHLFTTNRWVTVDTIFSAENTIRLLDGFRVDPSIGKYPDTNRWVTGMVTLFRPQVEQLIRLREDAINARRQQKTGSGRDVYQDRGIEIASILEISILDQLDWLEMLE